MGRRSELVTPIDLEGLIFSVRGMRVMLDSDLARIYGVSTSQLNQQLKRNQKRFPKDFAFQLNRQEFAKIRSQFVTASRRSFENPPWVFTEHGAIMLASVLNSGVAIEASVRVVRAFIRLRAIVASHAELAAKFKEIESKLEGHDVAIIELFATIKQLIEGAPEEYDVSPDKKREIGFHVKNRANGNPAKKVGL